MEKALSCWVNHETTLKPDRRTLECFSRLLRVPCSLRRNPHKSTRLKD